MCHRRLPTSDRSDPNRVGKLWTSVGEGPRGTKSADAVVIVVQPQRRALYSASPSASPIRCFVNSATISEPSGRRRPTRRASACLPGFFSRLGVFSRPVFERLPALCASLRAATGDQSGVPKPSAHAGRMPRRQRNARRAPPTFMMSCVVGHQPLRSRRCFQHSAVGKARGSNAASGARIVRIARVPHGKRVGGVVSDQSNRGLVSAAIPHTMLSSPDRQAIDRTDAHAHPGQRRSRLDVKPPVRWPRARTNRLFLLRSRL